MPPDERDQADTPRWAALVEEGLRLAPVAATSMSRAAWDEAFAGIFAPFTSLAETAMTGGLEVPGADLVAIAAAFRRRLGVRLARIAARTLVSELHDAARNHRLDGAEPQDRFAHFIAGAATRDGLTGLFRGYPVLARLVAQNCLHAADALRELLGRFTTDRDALVSALLRGNDPGPLVAVAPGAGDGHRLGRSVAVLHFADGTRIVYKPRPMEVYRHFNEFARWLRPHLGELTPPTVEVLTRPGYGYAAFAAPGECADAAGIERFYRRLGALLAVLHVLDATDIHYENLIARGDEPVVVDLETMFHPAPTWALSTGDPALAVSQVSVLRIALLPLLLLGDETAVDISGLGGDRNAPMPVPSIAFADAGTDRMRVVREPSVMPGADNRPRLGGVEMDPADHLDSIVDGFRFGYRRLAGLRSALIGDRGRLARFAGDEVRVVVAPTRLYATLLDESTHPSVLGDFESRDHLFREHCVDPVKDPAVAECEIADLWNSDVPYFSCAPGGTAMHGSDGRKARDLDRTRLSHVEGKLAGMGEADLDRQEWLIRAALAGRDLTDPHHATPAVRLGPAPAADAPTRDELLDAATAIAERLVDQAVSDDGRVNWLGLELVGDRFWHVAPLGASLGSGYLGVSLFLAQLAEITGRADLARTARLAVTAIPSVLDTLAGDPETAAVVGPGGFAGLGGIGYGLARLAVLLDDDTIGGWATTAAELTYRCGVRDDDAPDSTFASGLAGGLTALLSIDRLIGSRQIPTWASELAARLAGLPDPGVPGFAGGSAGVDWALRNAGVDRPRRTPSGDGMSWCRGLSGVVIAGTATEAEWTALAHGEPLAQDALCHGEFGVLEALASPGAAVCARAYRTRLARALARIGKDGPVCATPGRIPSPGMLTGLSGIGYGLLRAAHPDRVGSLLLLQATPATHPSDTNLYP